MSFTKPPQSPPPYDNNNHPNPSIASPSPAHTAPPSDIYNNSITSPYQGGGGYPLPNHQPQPYGAGPGYPPPNNGGYYDQHQQGGYPPQQGYYNGPPPGQQQQHMYGPQPGYGQHPGMYPVQGQYVDRRQGASAKDGFLGACLGALACCCCLDLLF